MNLDPQTQKQGYIWLFASGTFAILLAFALFNVDQLLSTAPWSKTQDNELKELRAAQTSLSSQVSDTRQSPDQLKAVRMNESD